MADFIMTMSSDDEASNGVARASTSKPVKVTPSRAEAVVSEKAQVKKKKAMTRKEQLKASRRATATEQTNQKKRKHAETGSDEDEDADGVDTAIQDASEGREMLTMAEDFHFDGLGGGFVGDRRQLVWDAGEAYFTKRPNAIPRVTVNEIIARRAPIRLAKARNKAAKEDENDSDDDDVDDLEKEMMEALSEGSEGSEEESDDELLEDGDEEQMSDEDGYESEKSVSSKGFKEKSAVKAKGSANGDGFEEEDEEDWLGIGNHSDDEAKIPNPPESSEGTSDEAISDDSVDEKAPGGFAALADMEDDLEDSESDVPADLKLEVHSFHKTPVDATEAAAAKAYFTSHANASSSSSSKVTFSTLPSCTLSRQLLLSLGSLNLNVPTPIQRECIPVAMLGKDIVASSATGSGKTVAFWVGVLERLLHRDRKNPTTRVVVMTPTRELAVQVHGVGVALARYTDVQFCLCVGGLSLKVQEAELKQRPDIVVSTPGRLIDHVRNTPCFNMDGVEILVLDEADRMLEEGFRAELEEIISSAPKSRQTLLFSATVTESVGQLSRLSMNKPVRVKIDEMGATALGLVQEFLRVRGDKAGEAIERGFRSGERSREALLVSLCTRSFSSGRTIIFFRSKAQAHRMKIIFTLFGSGLEKSDELHGDLTQEQRLGSLKNFREGVCSFLLATDLASRGLDIKGIENVINYEMPRSIEIYLHRVGRTARAGKKGRALTLVGESDRKLVKLAMKHAPPESIKQRVIAPEIINEVSLDLKELEAEVKAVQREEQEEKEFRKGDMELTKGRNLIEHEMEIKARPARTWFQTTSEKNVAKNAGLAEHNSKFPERPSNKRAEVSKTESKPPKRTPFSGLSRKEKRRKMAAEEDRADQEAGMKNSIVASVRSAKKAALPRKMTVVAPERIPGQTPKKKKGNKKGGFEKELGMAGRAERENGGAGPDDPRRKSKQAGSNAGRRPIVGFGKGNKRMLKAGKRL